MPAGVLVVNAGRTSVSVDITISAASPAPAPSTRKVCSRCARPPSRTHSTDDARADDHHGGVDRVARQDRHVVAAGDHHREDERGLDHGHGQGQDERAEGLAHAMRDDLGVVDGGDHRPRSERRRTARRATSPRLPRARTTSKASDSTGMSQVQSGMAQSSPGPHDSAASAFVGRQPFTECDAIP